MEALFFTFSSDSYINITIELRSGSQDISNRPIPCSEGMVINVRQVGSQAADQSGFSLFD